MSLKSNLQQLIKDRRGEILTINELEAYCKKANYKLSNAERRLRRSESPEITSVYNDKHTAIIGYKYVVQNDNQTSRQIIQPDSSQAGQVPLSVQLPLPKGIGGYANFPLSEA